MLVRLPLSPTTNNLFVNVPGKGRVASQEYRKWVQTAGLTLNVAKRGQTFGKMLVQVGIMVPRKNRGDIDNRAKAVLDLFTVCGVWDDDKQVERLTIERHDDKDLLVSVMPYEALGTQGGGGE